MEIPERTLNCAKNDERLSSVEKKVYRVEDKIESLPVVEKLLEEVIASNNSQSETMENFNMTLTKVNTNMEHMYLSQQEMKATLSKTQSDVEELKEERNVNIMKTIQQNWWKIILVGFGVYEMLDISGVIS